MIASFVNRPVTTIMFVLFFIILGFVSFFNLNIEQNPKIEFPLVVVNVTYPGASPLEIETQVIKKIEDSVAEISEIKKVESRSFENFGYILVEFYLSADVNNKLIEVKDKVEVVLNELPDDIDRPIVQKVDPFAQSVVDLVLSSDNHSLTELYEYADNNIKNQFSKISGVGNVDIFGGRQREFRVELFPDLMKQKFISIEQVVAQMKARNLTVPSGNIDQKQSSVSVRFEGEFKNLEDLKNLQLNTSEGASFYLKDIGHVYDGSSEMETAARYNGEEVVSLSIKKISDGNEVEVASGVRAILPEIQQSLPKGMKLELALDKSQYILRETQGTFESISLGIVLTILVLLFFTGNWRLTIVSAVVIPSSIISALFLMDISGFTINFITLLAVATSLGTLIANAIVVIEGILEHLNKGRPSVESAIQGTKDMVIPVLAAGGTNLVVFTPIAFMGGIIGQFMLQFGMTVVYTTIFSLIASFSLTPMLCALLLKPSNKDKQPSKIVKMSNAFVAGLLGEYKKFYNLMFKYSKTSTLMVIILFIGAFTVTPYLGNEFIPVSDEDRLEVKLTLPLGTKVEETLKYAKSVEDLFVDIPEVASVLTVLGRDGEQNASVVVNLLPSSERQKSDVDIIDQVTPQLANVPSADVEVIRGQGGANAKADISINIFGTNYDDMIAKSKKAMQIMRESGYFRSVVSSYKTPKEELRFYPNPSLLEKYGVSSAQLGGIFRASIYGDDSNIIRQGGEEYDIRVKLADEFIDSADSMEELFVISKTGLVPVTELGKMTHKKSVPTILRRDRRRVIQLNGYLSKSTAGIVQTELTEKFNNLDFKNGSGFKFVGNAESQKESGREIGKAFLLAVILTYMILAAIMNSFIHPFTIATSIITSYAGAFLLLFFLGSSINIASMLGIIMLVGLAVNNAILIIEESLLKIKQQSDISIVDALWHGIQSKFRAVLMTSVAIVFGALPQVWSPDLAKASMGAVIVGGVLASIFFTFFLTPQIFYFLERLRRFTKKVV